MSFDQLIELRATVSDWISKKATAVRAELQAKLDALGDGTVSSGGGKRRGRPPGRRSKLKGRKVPPKYRDPKTGETWSGRGAMVGWMAAAIKAGKKRDDFLIARGGKRRKAKR